MIEIRAKNNGYGMIDKAIDFIKKHEPEEGYFVGFSGGKDSIVTLDLVRRAGVKHQAYYSMTLIDPPEVVAFIREQYPDVLKLKPDYTFWQGILDKGGLPSMHRRWCCDKLKHGTKSSKAVPLNHRIVGVRAEESPRRAKLGQVSKFGKWTMYRPIFEWSSVDIWDHIRANKLPYPALYDEGFARLGCVVCPFLKGNGVKKHRERWPNIYRILDLYIERIWEKNHEKFEALDFTKEQFAAWPNWKSKEERKQLSLYT